MVSKSKARNYWTKERVQEVALKCKSRSELNDSYKGAYCSAHKNGWLDEVCSHMVSKSKPRNYWTKERVQEVALKCKSRSEFDKLYKSVYQAAHKYGWIEEVCSHMEGYIQWDYEKVKEVALKCKSRSEFWRLYGSAYGFARKNDWFDEVCSHMEKNINDKPRYIYVFIWEDVKLVYVGLTEDYKKRRRQHFNINNDDVVPKTIKKYGEPIFKVLTKKPIDVNLAGEHEQKWVDSYIELGYTPVNIAKPGSLGSYSRMWNFEKVKKVALKCKTRSEFDKLYSGAYSSALKNGWFDDVCSHMPNTQKPKGYWTKKRVYEAALKCKTRKEFQMLYGSAYNLAVKKGWFDEVCSHMETLRVQWDFEKVKEVALRCKTRSEFHKLYGSASAHARKYGWIEEVCSHMKKKEIQWNFKSVKKVALKCKTRSEFHKLYKGAYNSAYKNGWLDEVCSHMETLRVQWDFEKVKEVVLKCKSKREFYNLYHNAYQIGVKNGWLDILFPKENLKPGDVGYWNIKENVKMAALKCKTRSEFWKLYGNAYQVARRNGWLDILFPKENLKPGDVGYWNIKENVKKVALKCKSRSEFQKLYKGAYNSVLKNGWLNEVCSHMIKR